MKTDVKATALLCIDVINSFEFPNADHLLKHAFPAAKKIAKLRTRMREMGVPCIYVNDNFGCWQSSFREQIDNFTKPECKGRDIVLKLLPTSEDYFVLKPKHSAFYASSLPVLLSILGKTHLILTGFAGDICVLYTANDAYMRDYSLTIPADCIASETQSGNSAALAHMKSRLKANVILSTSIR